MNPEEFDTRLSESFKNEHLPPDKKLWEGITSRLDESSKSPFWIWLVPIVLAITAFGGLLMMNNNKEISQTSHQKYTYSNTEVKKTAPLKLNESKPDETNENKINLEQNSNEETTISNNTIINYTSESENNNNHSSINYFENPIITKSGSNSNVASQSSFNLSSTITKEDDFLEPFLSMNKLISPPITHFEPLKEELITYTSPYINKKAYKSPYTSNPVNFESKWWWSAGIGPQVAFNKVSVPVDSQAWVHKELWANTSKMTGNSNGFQSQLLLGHKIGKYFSLEAGLQYSLHNEDIRFNLTSYDVESRDQNNKITRYDSIQLFIGVWNPLTLKYDTTFYNATRSFSLSIKNRYNIYTIPVKFNFEANISDRSKLVIGIGAGFSAITSKQSTHLNLINDQETIDNKVHQYTASLNAQLGFYTNFNDIGQLGIYSGFQMYTKPWELSNMQYAIKMSDLQLGISFRRPINW